VFQFFFIPFTAHITLLEYRTVQQIRYKSVVIKSRVRNDILWHFTLASKMHDKNVYSFWFTAKS